MGRALDVEHRHRRKLDIADEYDDWMRDHRPRDCRGYGAAKIDADGATVRFREKRVLDRIAYDGKRERGQD